MIHHQQRILIVYPYANIDTNPTMALLLELLAQRDVEVDLLVGRDENYITPTSYGLSVHLKEMNEESFWSPLCFDPDVFDVSRAEHYDAIIGVDPHGIIFADALNHHANRPLVYASFEILLSKEAAAHGETQLESLERAACDRTALLLIQDEERADIFCRDKSFPRAKVALVPVSPAPTAITKSDYFREKFGISKNKRIVLFSGSLYSWSCFDEFAELVSDWPERFCLVIHNRSRQSGWTPYLDQLLATNRVFLSTEPVPRETLPELISSADFGLACYKPTGEDWFTGNNLYHLGLASGKVAYYSLCGLPILARPLPVFERAFQQYDCGRIYRCLADSGTLLEELDRNYEHHSREARRYYEEQMNPTQKIESFCERLLQLADGSWHPQDKIPSLGSQ